MKNYKSTNWRNIVIPIIALIVAIFGYLQNDSEFQSPNQHKPKTKKHYPNRPDRGQEKLPKPNRPNEDDLELSFRGKDLIYTKHALCRMGCRFISKEEVGEVLKNGKINKRKSNPNDNRCPTVALEAITSDGQLVRAIIANCDNVAKLVTVIDLKNHYQCHCD